MTCELNGSRNAKHFHSEDSSKPGSKYMHVMYIYIYIYVMYIYIYVMYIYICNICIYICNVYIYM